MQLLGSPPPERRIVRLVGSGGMGVVYEAWDTRLERRVALKVLHPHLTVNEAMRDRLLKEARLAARVEHEGVVRIYNIHEQDDGVCLEMQFVEGIPLNRMLRLHALSPAHGADLLRQTLEALIACHARNVVHCDLKPSNLLVTPDGKIMLADFGISRAVYPDGETELPTASLSGPMWGTPQYSPPEAWEGEMPTPSWDLYALGVLVHEALSGALPFKAQTAALLMREKLEGAPIPIGEKRHDLSPQLSGLIDALHATDTQRRPTNGEHARELLRRAPEFQNDAIATLPFRHSEAETIEGNLVPSVFGPAMTLAEPSVASFAGLPLSSWKLGLVWTCVPFVAGVLFFASFFSRGHESGIGEVPFVEADGLPGKIHDLVVNGRSAYFSYDDGQRGRELWLADADGQVSILADINQGKASSNPRWILPRRGGGVLFAATDSEHGEEPRVCEAAPSFHVRMLRDIIPGPMSSEPRLVATWEKLSLFYASTLEREVELWVTNGAPFQTGKLFDSFPNIDIGSTNQHQIICSEAGGLYFAHSMPRGDTQLWRYEPGEGKLRSLGAVENSIGEMAMLGTTLVFPMSTPQLGMELWMYDPTLDEIRLLKDIWPGSESGEPEHLFAWNGAMYFRAATAKYGIELWKTDGTPAGTVQVADINPLTQDSGAYGFVATKEHLFFRANDLLHGDELWVTDGEIGGATRVFDVFPGPDSAHPYSIAAVGEFLLFSADDGVHGEELWALELENLEKPPFLVHDIRPGPESSEPHSLTAMGGNTAIFVYKTLEGDALMKIDAGTDGFPMTPYRGLRPAKDDAQ